MGARLMAGKVQRQVFLRAALCCILIRNYCRWRTLWAVALANVVLAAGGVTGVRALRQDPRIHVVEMNEESLAVRTT